MKKNPFSLYDFLGYVFPGALALILIHFLYGIMMAMGGNYQAITINTIADYIKKVNWELGWENTVVFIILAYCAGHVIAYASSLTVEKLSNWLYGYPSAYIMGNPSFFNNLRTGNYWKSFIPWKEGCAAVWKRLVEILWKLLTSLIMLPITLCCFLLGYVFQVEKLYLKPVDGNLRNVIQKHTEQLLAKLGCETDVDYRDSSSDFHRLIYNYEYDKREAHRIKMDNYVAIYGFLRALTFISNGLFVAYVFFILRYKVPFNETWHQLLFLIGITYLLFMSFMKFYRRFTMESFMCLSIDTDI